MRIKLYTAAGLHKEKTARLPSSLVYTRIYITKKYIGTPSPFGFEGFFYLLQQQRIYLNVLNIRLEYVLNILQRLELEIFHMLIWLQIKLLDNYIKTLTHGPIGMLISVYLLSKWAMKYIPTPNKVRNISSTIVQHVHVLHDDPSPGPPPNNGFSSTNTLAFLHGILSYLKQTN